MISFTKFTSPEAMMEKLATVEPGTTTAAEVEQLLESTAIAQGSTPSPLWNDLIDYDPPVDDRAKAGSQVVIDNELLRSARDAENYQYLVLWAALNLADTRLDTITQTFLTDDDGRFDEAMINRQALGQALTTYAPNDPSFPKDGKPVMNILSLLERCRLIVPEKHGGSIIGVERLLPTRSAAVPVVKLVAERLSHQGIVPVRGRNQALAVAIGANAWLGLSSGEFLDALRPRAAVAAPAGRSPLPDDLYELATQVRRRGQVVLQGPPGAGKTYVARRYVQWATSGHVGKSRLQAIIDSLPVNERTVDGIAAEVQRLGIATLWDIVQFHPGYDYTDFVRALVAEPVAGGVTFTPRHKLFSLMVGVGNKLKEEGYDLELVLILDEMNRGNIPNIFGELLYGLEYRGEAVSTPYAVDGDASITVPESLHVIGTMNTADRSIAVIDYALRRRFVFLDVYATDAPIHSYDFDSEITREAALHLSMLTAQALSDAPAGLQVGPSYFLADADEHDSSLEVLAGRYVYEVLPLLSEYEMEGEIDAAALNSLRSQLALAADATQRQQAEGLADLLAQQVWAAADGDVPADEDPVEPAP
ncbi:McrB family protein [Gordonia sp. (in: high G+C Gram-positive bacteria)]|uniref:McrB family protein n=1 Tax=Gordonia sp. (in: high G+C Gram-positive bacteria) TaxID=84139 RepID=UPI002618F4CD|nr:AAA family ATPase [Gordonia sp. (in: high G+C Gram-positive bacteria)]HMS73906.1 AAA family ATPase [Gordonia sp. (in: high G+C Gram-positive bacteria)]